MSLSTYVAAAAVVSVLALPIATNPAAAAIPWCGTESLSASTGPPMSPGEQEYIHFNLLLTNVSQQTCTMQGYPGVDLVGPYDPMMGGPTVSLVRTGGDVQPVVLAPGASASSLVGFMPKTSDLGLEPAWPPSTMVVTPPDATTQLVIPWLPGGFTVLLIGDGTQPAATIGPLSLYA